jgi:hypothetical protein
MSVWRSGLREVLEWAVIAIPVVVGFAQWVIPIRQPKRSHRLAVFIGCALFSVLIGWQQHIARQEHLSEMAKLPTKDDLKRLPTASEIVTEFKRIAPAAINQSPWGMTDEQLTRLTERISIYAPFSSERAGSITAVVGATDSLKFAERLAAAFKAAHWKGFQSTDVAQGVFTQPVEGIIINLRDENDQPAGLSEFVQTLRESGIEPKGNIDPAVPKDEFWITVGSRPSK